MEADNSPVWTVFEIEEKERCAPDIGFSLNKGMASTSELTLLKSEVEHTLTTLRVAFPLDGKSAHFHREMFRHLLSIAQLGLVQGNVKEARDAHGHLRERILIISGPSIKNSYMAKLGIQAVYFSIAAALLYVGCNLSSYIASNAELLVFQNYLIVWIGCMAGSWCSFAIRKPSFTFEDISVVEKDMISPTMRLIFCGILTLIVSLVFTAHIADVVIGSFKASSLENNAKVALIVGLLSGVSETALPQIVSQRATAFLASGADARSER